MTNTENKTIGQNVIAVSEKKLIDISLPRIKKCLSCLTEEEIWYRPNNETVSVGNLVLHLCGNVRQWIVFGLGGEPDIRNRPKEFSEQGPIPTNELIDKLEKTLADAKQVLRKLDDKDLLKVRNVQGYQETGTSILITVVEHFSYHVGQISYYVKSRKGIDLKYYHGVALTKTG